MNRLLRAVIVHSMEETEHEIQTYWNAIHQIHVLNTKTSAIFVDKIDCNSIQERFIEAARNIVNELLAGTCREIDRININIFWI